MPQYLVQRTIVGAGRLLPADLDAIARRMRKVALTMRLTWERSFVAEHAFWCIVSAPNEHTVREHARRCGLPVDQVVEFAAVLNPVCACAVDDAPAVDFKSTNCEPQVHWRRASCNVRFNDAEHCVFSRSA